jgi:hypothetical protein
LQSRSSRLHFRACEGGPHAQQDREAVHAGHSCEAQCKHWKDWIRGADTGPEYSRRVGTRRAYTTGGGGVGVSRGVTKVVTSSDLKPPWPAVAYGPGFDKYLDELSSWIRKEPVPSGATNNLNYVEIEQDSQRYNHIMENNLNFI